VAEWFKAAVLKSSFEPADLSLPVSFRLILLRLLECAGRPPYCLIRLRANAFGGNCGGNSAPG
jgi:hypothetical protein